MLAPMGVQAAEEEGVPACLAPVGRAYQAAGVTVRDVTQSNDMAGTLRVEASNGAHLFVYFDATGEATARSRAPCLGHQLNLLRTALSDTRTNAEWVSVVFTADADYAPPRGDGVKTQLVVRLTPTAPAVDGMVLSVIPHEQVHDYQSRVGARLPRWLAEGHASWVELRIASALHPGEGKRLRASSMDDLAQSDGRINLVGWGQARPKREAIMRQVSDDDRARMENDPDYFPNGAFQFTSDDFENDVSNEPARYAAALLVFEGLQERHGTEAVREWVRRLSSQPGALSAEAVTQSVQNTFDEDLDSLLADPT